MASQGNSVTLVSAQAGYGKSTLVSQWLIESEVKSAWLSLDPTDSDLRPFLAYVIAAIQTVFPDSCGETTDCLKMAALPPPGELAGLLSNDLDQVDCSFALVLDDYHHLSDPKIHDFLDGLLRHPPQYLHLIIIARRDPPLALQTLRARGVLTEIRMQDLAFTESEASDFISKCLGESVSNTAIARLHRATEGWPVALRLALLAAPEAIAINSLAQKIPSEIRDVREYLLKEVLAQQPPAARVSLLQTSFLNRFNAALCQVVTKASDDDTGKMNPDESGERFIQHVRKTGLPGIPLDNHGEWFRYHHLFQSMLQYQAAEELGEAAIHNIHLAASRWLEQQGHVEEAIHHRLAADGPTAAGALIVRHRNKIMNFEHWYRLETWLRLLPPDQVAENPALLILQARWQVTRGLKQECWATVDKIDQLLDSKQLDSDEEFSLRGSLESLRCYQHYCNSKGSRAVESARYALKHLPADCFAERGFSLLLLANSLQMTGEYELAKQTIYDVIATDVPSDDAGRTLRGRLFMSLCFIHWIAANLQGLKTTSAELVEAGGSLELQESHLIGRYFQAAVLYHENKLGEAGTALENVMQYRAVANVDYFTQCAFINALVLQEQGLGQNARSVAQFMMEFSLKQQNKPMVLLSEAFLAELAIRQGRMSEAMEWAQNFDPRPFEPMYSFYSPQMTLAKCLVLDDRAASHDRARVLLEELLSYLGSIHNKRFQIEVLALKALLSQAAGAHDAAVKELTKAISLALPGRFIRLFVDLGPRLAGLLSALDLDEEGLLYVGEILAASRPGAAGGAARDTTNLTFSHEQSGIDPLSKREQQILILLAERLSNKEIGEQLNISVVTVKRHAANIYQKLSVNGRRQAVAKAAGLGLFQ